MLVRIRVWWHCWGHRSLCSTASNRAMTKFSKVTLMQERVTIHVMGKITFHTCINTQVKAPHPSPITSLL